MAFIRLGNINKNLIPIVIGSVVCFLNRLLNLYEGTLLFKNVILLNICISLSRFLAIIPYIILKIKSKQNQNSDLNDINDNKLEYIYIYIDNEQIIIQGKGRFILLSGILYLIQQNLYIASIEVKTNSWIWTLLFTAIFYYLLFKAQIYRHHYLSAVLILLIGLVIDLVLGNLQNDIMNNFVFLVLKFIQQALFSLYNVLGKYVMVKKFVSVYEFSTFIGAFVLSLLLIFVIFDYYFFKIDDYDEYFSNFNFMELLVIFGVIFTQFGINLCSLFTVKDDSPCHMFIMFVFGQLAYYVNFDENSIFVFICLIIILFLSLIFSEIIELNFLGLSYNTKRNITERARNEDDLLITKCDTIDSKNDKDENLIELNENYTLN
jgi:hypothetical protein